MKIGRKIMTPIYLVPEQHKQLKALSKQMDRPMQQFMREGIDLVIEKYATRRTKK